MKKGVFIVFLALSQLVTATTYYVSPFGSDINQGTKDKPWATWGRGFSSAHPGDTVYFRGGVYPMTVKNGSGYTITCDGAIGDTLCFFNYPGEFPILDCSSVTSSTSDLNVAISADGGPYYTKFRGLTVRNVRQFDGNDTGVGWLFWTATGVVFENCTTYNVHGIGFLLYGGWDVRFVNCDAYNCADELSSYRPGNSGSGFQYINFDDTDTEVYYKNCRAWHCSDQGFALGSAGYTEYDNCWAWGNGYLTGEGDGFKLGWMGASSNNLQILVKNCWAGYNSEAGFNDNSSTSYPAGYLNIYNNTSYRNGSFGYMFFNTASNDAVELKRITRNNIAFMDGAPVFNQAGSLYTHEYNSWDLPVTITSADFMSLDSTGISGPRLSDGSLPHLYFLRLKEGSDLIDAGTPATGLLYNNDPLPDLGAFQYIKTGKSPKLVTSISVTGAAGASTISADNGTLHLTATVLPADATNKSIIWSISNGSDKATVNTTGLVTALDNGTAVARATANDGSGVYGEFTITLTNQVISVSSIVVTGAGGSSTITTDNGTLQLAATVLPANATKKSVTWSISSGNDKASINSSGLVAALANGNATVTATSNDGSGISGSLIITISNQITPVSSITITGAGGSSLITNLGGTLQLYAAVLPSNATNKSITWSILDGTDKASISYSGLVTATDNGTIIARATSNDGSGVFDTLAITISNRVIPVTGITVTGSEGASAITTKNGTLQLSAAVLPYDATDKSINWSISEGIDKATINTAGLVTAIKNGTVVAKATSNDGSGVLGSLSITITNQFVPVTGITVTVVGGSSTITTHNGTLQLSATVLPADATNKNVTWSVTTGSTKASISSTGLVTGLANGIATATATANDGSGLTGSYLVTISYVSNTPPIIVLSYQSSSYSGFVNTIDASETFDINMDNLTFNWIPPDYVHVSSTSGSTIEYLGPNVNSPQIFDFLLNVSDGKTTQSKIIPVEILPFKPDLEVAEISKIEASSYETPFYPSNIIDGNIGTGWSANGENEWLILELKHSFSVLHIKLTFLPGQKRESYFDILGSNDKLNWEPIITKTSSCAFSGELQVFEFPPSKSGKEFKYIKLVGLGNSIDKWNYLSELKIFGFRHKKYAQYENLAVKIYPNPAREFVKVRIDDMTLNPESIQLIDFSGSVILTEEIEPGVREFSFPINIKSGIYIIQLSSGSLTIFTQKLIVMN